MTDSARRITIYDIARRLDLSPSTVSRALNNSNLVETGTRERVMRAAQELGHQKRRIRRHRRRAILNVVLFLPFDAQHYLHLFYDTAELVHALHAGIGDVRANVISVVSDSQVRMFDQKKLGDIDACVFAFTSPTDDLMNLMAARSIPMVLINRIDDRYNFVVSDHAHGMSCLLEALSGAIPAPRPCFIGFPVVPQVSRMRCEGLQRAAARLNVPFTAADVYDVRNLNEITPERIERLLDHGYNALMCFNDVLAVYVYQCALGMGLSIPDDFSLTGFDNSPVRSLVSAEITTVDLLVPRLGFHAGRWLRETIIDKREEQLHLHIPGPYIPGNTIARRTARAAN